MKKIIVLCFIIGTLSTYNTVFGMLTQSIKKYTPLKKHSFHRGLHKMSDEEYVSWINETNNALKRSLQSAESDKKTTQDQQLLTEKKEFADYLYQNTFAQENLRNYLLRTEVRNEQLKKKIKLQNNIANRIKQVQKLDRSLCDKAYGKDTLANLVYEFNDLEKEIKAKE